MEIIVYLNTNLSKENGITSGTYLTNLWNWTCGVWIYESFENC